ncbi:MAG: hypothetical protein D6704_03565 [Nitrospirae bacterium]|nr:MAG: hypothetical protein D6704_03565 [Nitrospirota bacterium]
MPSHHDTVQFHVAITHESHPEKAGTALAQTVDHAQGPSVDLACLFCSGHYGDRLQDLLDTLHRHLTIQVLIGCMGEGVIGGTEEFEGPATVILWTARLPQVKLSPFHVTFHEREQGYSLHGWPGPGEWSQHQPTFVLLADPFSTPIETLLATIERDSPGSLVIGGVASGGSDLGENRLLYNREVFHSGAVGVAFIGPISIRTLVSQGCQPIGERFVVTKAQRNVIYELGGVPALERLQATLNGLGAEGARRAVLALQVGIAFDEHRERFTRGDFLIRGVLGADQRSGSIAVSDVVTEGQTVQFHLRDAQAAREELHLLLAHDRLKFSHQPPRAALVFSCNGRGRRFFGEPHHDIRAILQHMGTIPVAGFFAAGEIGPVGNKNFVHGYTASVALFSEACSDPLGGVPEQ